MTAVWTVKTQRKRISSHLKNRSPTKPIRYKLVCEQSRQFALHWVMFFLFLCLLLPSSSSLLVLNFKSVFSLQRISVENLPPRGFGATCCACVSFALEIVRDLPMVNIVSQTMNKHNKPFMNNTWNAPWSSAAKSLLPGNAKCSMTSVADTKHKFVERFMYGASNFAANRRQKKLENQHMMNERQPFSWRMTSTNVSIPDSSPPPMWLPIWLLWGRGDGWFI